MSRETDSAGRGMVVQKGLKIFPLIPAFLMMAACSSDPDVEVSIGENQYWGTLTFDIRAKADEAVIKKVTVNRGNCSLPEGTATDIGRTVHLKFGEAYRGYSNDCKMENVREIQVTTEKGEFVFSFS